MDAHHKPLPLRLAVFLVLVLLHRGLILIFLHDEPAHMDLPAPTEVPTVLFFIEAPPLRELPRPDIIDYCFGKVDFGHEQTGQSQRYQLGCALGKQPARGDLFDSLRKPSELPK